MVLPQLHTTTSYTLLHSTLRIPQLVAAAKEKGYQTLAITDRNVMSGTVEFYQACLKQGIQPIIGLHLDYTIEETGASASLLLYAKNPQGYQHLIHLSTYNMTHSQPLSLSEHRDKLSHLYAVLPAENELTDRLAVAEADQTGCYQRWQELQSHFDADALYLGVTLTELAGHSQAGLLFARAQQLPLLALQSVRYLRPEEGFSVQVLKHIADGTMIEGGVVQSFQEIRGEEYLREAQALTQIFTDNQLGVAVANAEQLAAGCRFELPLHQRLLPHYPVPEEQPAGSYLQKLCYEALPKRVASVTPAYEERLAYELQVIHEMGFDDYFLIVWDVMDFAHRQQIVTGAGRGSAAGSLVAYVLAITDVDPLVYDLLFERFLNPERYTMPDIDLDIPDNRREEILKYVQQKYGAFHMAQIATFGTMAAKMVLRDVARVFGLSQSEANRWSKAIPNRLKITLAEAVKESKQLATLAEQSEQYQLLLTTAQQLEGLPRHVSTHAAGVVISDQDLLTLVPLQEGSEEILLTQFTMNDVEAVGLLKMDFLGLRNLSIIDNTLQSVKKVYRENLDFKKIPLDDAATLKLFQKGETSGVFQFESAGIRNVLRKLEPNSIEDIAAVNALYRPGPMQNIDTFIRRKKGQEPIQYPDESLKDILGNTYGVMVYQEQVMQVASKMAGFSLGQADILRRAMSKKQKTVLDEQKGLFVAGALQQGYSQSKAEEVYGYIERFANYGFNRSHAFAYSFVGFQMAYLKVHYPAPFYTAILHSVRHSPAKIKEYVSEARKNTVKILPPVINQSSYSFKIMGQDTLLFGFSSLKGIRRDFIQEILDERRENGPYRSLDQFLLRVHNKWLKPENIEPLIAIGAFDELNANRRQLMLDLDSKIQSTLYSGGSMDLLDIMAPPEREVANYSTEERLALEEQYLGVYLSGHPTESYEKVLRSRQVQSISDGVPGEKLRILYYVKDIREIRTKKGELMAFLEGSDLSGELAVTIFPQLYRQVGAQLAVNKVYYIEGKVERSNYNQELQLLAEKAVPAAELEAQAADQVCYLQITPEHDQPAVLQRLLQLMKAHSGTTPVITYFPADGRKIQLAEEFWVSPETPLQQKLQAVLGNENVIFRKM